MSQTEVIYMCKKKRYRDIQNAQSTQKHLPDHDQLPDQGVREVRVRLPVTKLFGGIDSFTISGLHVWNDCVLVAQIIKRC